jgi:hypothetical protein
MEITPAEGLNAEQSVGFWPLFLGLIGLFCTQKPVCFNHFKMVKSFVFTRSLSLFRQKSIFFSFPADFLSSPGGF